MPRIIKSRAVITVGPDVTVKRYHQAGDAAREIRFYERFPWACPVLLDADLDAGRLIIATHPIADALTPDPPPITELAELLRALEAEHVHHRDVHPGNIALTDDGPRLIDWETAIISSPNQRNPFRGSRLSYDLYGPIASGVSPPAIHRALPHRYEMWWGSDHPRSIKNQWRTDVPTSVA